MIRFIYKFPSWAEKLKKFLWKAFVATIRFDREPNQLKKKKIKIKGI